MNQPPSIVDLLVAYGATLPATASRDKFNLRCPFHSDRYPSARVHVPLNRFSCYACDAIWKTPVELVAWYENLPMPEAERRMYQRLGIPA